jgi:hypothetical protein
MGEYLKIIPSALISFERFQTDYPAEPVLSKAIT